MAWTDKEEQTWFERWWRYHHPQPQDLDAVHERKARFRGFWSGASRLFPRHTPRPGSRWFSAGQAKAVESWFDEHDILMNCPVPGRKGLTPAVGTTEVTVAQGNGDPVVFSAQQADQITAESVLSFGQKMRSMLGTTNFRRLQQGSVRQREEDEVGF